MTVGSLKRSLGLLNLLALLALGGTAYGFFRHHREMASEFQGPSFLLPPRQLIGNLGTTEFTAIPLGRFPKPVEASAQPVETAPEETVVEALKALGTITNAVFAMPPYDVVRPSITFEFRDKTVKTLGLGEGLMSKPDPDRPGFEIADRYVLIGCERDPTSGKSYFRFDMRGDGKDIQRALWFLEEPAPAAVAVSPGAAPLNEGPVKGIFVGGAPKRPVPAEPEQPATDQPRLPPPPIVEQVTPPPPVVRRDNLPSLFDAQGDDFLPTDEGVRYLSDNYNNIVKDAQTSTYKDPRSGEEKGIHIRRIKPGSVASQFGIMEDDVILSVNNRSVSNRDQAINIVKDELSKKKAKIIEVAILRNGRNLTKRYDTRDPATRKAAGKELRGR